MDKKKFVEIISNKTGSTPQEVDSILNLLFEKIKSALSDGEKVFISNFGTFTPKISKATKKFSALLNREIEIPEKFRISFSPSSNVSEDINVKFKDEKPKILKEAAEREIEKRVTIMPPEKEEQIEKEKEETTEGEEKLEKEFVETGSEALSLSDELLEALKLAEQKVQEVETHKEVQEEVQKTSETLKEKEEASEMPEMNLNQDKPKFTYGEDLVGGAPLGSGTYQPRTGTGGTSSSPISGGQSTRESSSALWVTLIILLLGIIGVGIYWALSTDVTETKKEPVVTQQKEISPPVVVERQPSKPGGKQIIIAPEEYTFATPSDTDIKEKTSMIVEEPVTPGTKEKEVKQQTTQVTKPPVIVQEEKKITGTITPQEKTKPIQRKRVLSTTGTTTSKVSSQGDFYIQVNSYSVKKFADAFAKELRNKGFRAFVESADVPGVGTLYRVKVGYYADEDAAAKDYHNLRLTLKKEDIFVNRR